MKWFIGSIVAWIIAVVLCLSAFPYAPCEMQDRTRHKSWEERVEQKLDRILKVAEEYEK